MTGQQQPTSAAAKAELIKLYEEVNGHRPAPPNSWPMITRLTHGPTVERLPPGHSAWLVGPRDPRRPRSIVVLPALTADAPIHVRRRYLARVAAQGSGICPLCDGRVQITGPDPQRRRAGFRLLPVEVGVAHSTGCPATDFGDADRRWFEPPTGPGRSAISEEDER